MELFLEFLRENYSLIFLVLALLILILELIILLIKKDSTSVLSFIDKMLPEVVLMAEKKYGSGHGEDKLLYVFRTIGDSLLRVFNIKDSSSYEKYIKKSVELILCTPTKKEAFNG